MNFDQWQADNYARPHRSERHAALDAFAPPDAKEDFCCNGDRGQGRLCPREPPPAVPLTWADLRLAAFIVAVLVGFVLAGPMIKGWLS